MPTATRDRKPETDHDPDSEPRAELELDHYGYISPYLIHALKLGPQNAVITDRHWITIDGLGRTGLKIPPGNRHLDADDTRNEHFSPGTRVTITLRDGQFICTPGVVDHTTTPQYSLPNGTPHP